MKPLKNEVTDDLGLIIDVCVREGPCKETCWCYDKSGCLALRSVLERERLFARALFQPRPRNIPELQLCDKVFIKATRKVSTNLLSIMASGPLSCPGPK